MGKFKNFLSRLAGVLVLAIGLAHFAMPSFGYTPEALAAVPETQRDHFVYLGTYAIGTFLVTFGILTLLSNPGHRSLMETAFWGLMVIVWGVRLMLELVFPVDLPLFFLNEPHLPLLTAFVLILLGYAAGFAQRVLHREHLS